MDRSMEIIILAFILDCIIGDPQNPYHPVRLIGGFISLGVKLWGKPGIKSPVFSFWAGAALSLLTVGLAYSLTRLVVASLYNVGYVPGFSGETIICYFIIAPKALKTESMKVCRALESGELEKARLCLSAIVGRDTENLTFPQVVNAAVETVAENLSDGVIAPLVFVFIGGVPLGMAYKAVNTLDSMIGYRNETYEYFGKFAARLDDAVNFIPARISAAAMLGASAVTGGDIRAAFRIYMRDRHNHKSPNSAQTEAVCAGALGLRLGGDGCYKGMLVSKPTIGDHVREPAAVDIITANRMMYAATVLAILAMLGLRIIFRG